MKKLFYILVLAAGFVSACGKSNTPEQGVLQPDKIYFFYSQTCPHCHDALKYINKKYPGLQLSMINVSNASGMDLLLRCAKKFKLGRNIGTPLFCMGDEYIMGWAPEYEKKFDDAVKPFLK